MAHNKDERMSEIFDKFYGLLVFAVSKDVSSYDDVMDICQDVCTSFYSRYGKEEADSMPDARAKALLMKITKYKVIGYIRKRTRDSLTFISDCEEELHTLTKANDSVETIVINREILRSIGKDLQEASDMYRDPILLHAVACLSYEQVSEILEVPSQVLRTRICRYRKKLRELYQDN